MVISRLPSPALLASTVNWRLFPIVPQGIGDTRTLEASYALPTKGVPPTGIPLYSTQIVYGPTSSGRNSAVNPFLTLPATFTGRSVFGPCTLTASSALSVVSTWMWNMAGSPTGISSRWVRLTVTWLVSDTLHTNGH